MYINKKDFVLDTDTCLRGFTFRDLIDAAIANGDSIQNTLNLMINCEVEDARHLVEKYADDINDILQTEAK